MISGIRLRSRSFCASSKPFIFGKLMSSTARSGCSRSKASSAADAVLGLHDEETGLLQRKPGDGEQIGIVVDEQDLHAGASCGSSTCARVRACCRALERTRPPCRSTIDRTMNRPRPRPLSSGASPPERWNCSNSRASSDSRRTGAFVLDRKRRARRARRRAHRCESRYPAARTCSRSRAGSRAPASGAAGRRGSRARRRRAATSMRWPRCAISGSMSSRAATITSSNSTSCWRIASWPDSMRTLSSRLSMSQVEPLRAALQRRHELALRLRAHRADAVAAAARSTRAAPRAACGTRAKCSRARYRACGAPLRARSRRATPGPAAVGAGAALAITTRRRLSAARRDLLERARPRRRAALA